MSSKRNPFWLRGARGRFAVRGMRGRTEAEKARELAQVEADEDAYLVDHEPPADARRRRKGERAAKAKAQRDRMRAIAQRPQRIETALRKLGGIARTSWDWRRGGTWPGETPKRMGIRGIFRSRAGGISWEDAARSLRQMGYGPQHEDAGAEDTGWLVDALQAAADGDEVYPETAGDWVARREERERWRQHDQQRKDERAMRRANPKVAKRSRGKRKAKAKAKPRGKVTTTTTTTRQRKVVRKNPKLLVLANPTPSAAALEAFRRFHDTEPKSIRKLPGKGPDLVALGDLVEIVYKPTRGVRRGPAFVHKFGKGAVLAATVDGSQVVLVPSQRKPFRVDWERGIIG